MTAFVHYKNTPNIGDRACAPYHYFPFREAKVFHIGEPVPPSEVVIFGGGAIEPLLRGDGIHRDVEAETKIAWGIGTSRKGRTTWDSYVDDLDLVGIREYGRADGARASYVPCVSCMSPAFDIPVEPEHEVVFYSHGVVDIAVPPGVPHTNNRAPTIGEALAFIGSGETVVTNSFHGVYWGLLLGRKVVCLPFSSKFYGFKRPPAYCLDGDWRSAAREAHAYQDYLEDCRDINRAFAQRVSALISTRRRLRSRVEKARSITSPALITKRTDRLDVGATRLRQEGQYTYLEAPYSLPDRQGTLWMRTAHDVAATFDDALSDAFVLPSLVMAMSAGTNLRFTSPVSDQLLHNSKSALQSVLQIRRPDWKIADVQAEGSARANRGATGVGTGLSCGIDSLAAVYVHHASQPPNATRLTHLCQFNHAQQRNSENRWGASLPRYREVAAEVGLPLIEIGTNFSAQLQMPHTTVHSLLNAACATALDGLIGKYYYASGFQYRDVGVAPTKDIAQADPILMPLLGNDSIRFISSGGEFPRTLKTEMVSRMPVSRRYLEVCTKSPKGKLNCSACYKCLRTMATLDLLGELTKYGHVFNLALWRAQRRGYARKLLAPKVNQQMAEVRAMPDAEAVLREWATR